MIKLIVFDLWRTLVPATIDFVHLASLVKKQNLSLPEFTQRYEHATQLKKYSSFEELRKDFFKEFEQSDNELLEQELYEIYTNRVDKIRFYPGVPEVLSRLKKDGYKIALLSNTENLVAPVFERNLKLSSYFDFLGASYEIGLLKPNPKAFEFVLNKFNVSPREALMVGDSLRLDIAGAKKAGLHNCLINRLGKVIDYADVKPEFEIKSLEELPRVLGVLNANKKS